MRKIAITLAALGLVVATAAHASNPVRISQVYGGGGNYYSCDYVELFNGSNSPVNIGGWSVQYGSSSGTAYGSATYNLALIPAGATIPACGYYLIRGYSSSAGAALPVTPDLVPSTGWIFNFSGTTGKVALFSDHVTGRTCAQAQAAAVDMVGYGTANCYETAPAVASDNSSALVRAGDGAVDTDDNSSDLSKVAQPWPMHNSASPQNPQCLQGAAPPNAPTLVAPSEGEVNVVVPAPLVVAVSDPDGDNLSVQFYGRPKPLPPAPPVATAGTSIYSTSFQANWTASIDATSYRLDVSTSSGFETCLPGYQDLSVSGTGRTVSGLAPVTPYYYRVRAVGEGGTSGNSNTIMVATNTTPPPGECEVILLPDTQEYTKQELGGTIAMFQAQTQWVVDNRVSRNIVAVANEGDINDSWTEPDVTTEYNRSLTAMTKLEDPVTTGLPDGIPYCMIMGNHDYEDAPRFNDFYGVSRFSGRSYYGGHYGTTNDDNYILFSGAGLDFVLIGLSYSVDSSELAWAKSVLDAYPNRIGIVTSHAILDESQTIPAPWNGDGSAIYNALRGTPNLHLMACGHMSQTSSSPSWHGEGRRTDVYGGYTIHSLLADYQDRENGGHGLLRILHFVPAMNKVWVRTYSPYTDQWEADADSSSQFTLDVDLSGSGPGPEASRSAELSPLAHASRPEEATASAFALLGTVSPVASGSVASFSWDGLALLTQFEWYVRVSDGHTPPVTGPTWDFTTWGGWTPTLLSWFTASAVGPGIELRWEFSEPGRFSAVTIERAGGPGGPWSGVAVEQRTEGGETIAFDRDVQTGTTYWYRIAATMGSTRLTFGPIEATVGEAIREFGLESPLPNPTSGPTRLDFAVPRDCRLSLCLYDMQGRRVATLAEGAFPAGRHQAVWNGTNGGRSVPAGVYFVRLWGEGVNLSRRVVVTR
jgi:hypothetical protein